MEFTFKKRVAALILAAVMPLAILAGCSEDGGSTDTGSGTTAAPAATDAPKAETLSGDSSLRVWAPQEEQTLLKELVDEFKAANPDLNLTVDFGVVGEPDAWARYSEDPAAAADVFYFANDQLHDFVNAKGLFEIQKTAADIKARNVGGSVDAASVDGKLYDYPMTGDNGYFLIYDKSVLTADDVKSLDKILEVANKNNKKVFMDVSNGWYIASFFLGAGGTLTVGDDGKQKCDFNNADGLAAAEGIKAFTADPAFITGDNAVLEGGFGETIIAGVGGTWNATPIKEKLGDNFAAAKLPTFNAGGTEKQMASFGGFKLVGVNSLTQSPAVAQALADFITNEQSQAKRYAARELGPTNIKVADSAEVNANIALAALAAQSEFAVSQNDVQGSYWAPAEALGTDLENKDYSVELQKRLDDMVTQIQEG